MEGLVDKVSKVHNSIGILRLRMSSRSAALAPLPPPPIVPAGRDEWARLVLSFLPCPALLQGRNASEQVKMLQRIEQHNARQPPESKIQVSVEVEKPREELYQLFGYGDVF